MISNSIQLPTEQDKILFLGGPTSPSSDDDNKKLGSKKLEESSFKYRGIPFAAEFCFGCGSKNDRYVEIFFDGHQKLLEYIKYLDSFKDKNPSPSLLNPSSKALDDDNNKNNQI